MNSKTHIRFLLPIWLAILAFAAQLSTASAQGTAFVYQGVLNYGGTPATGSYDLTFTLFTTNITGASFAGPVTNPATGVTGGRFTTAIDFGPGVFTGNSFWLELAVRTNGGSGFTTLTPRQPITATPYAIFANSTSNLNGTVPLAQLPGVVLTNNEAGVNLTGGFTGNGGGLTNLNAAQLTTGTLPAATLPGNVVTNYSSAALLSDQNPAGEIWGGMMTPPVFFYFAPYPRIWSTNQPAASESNILAALEFIQTNGFLANLQAAGRQVVFQLDIGWDARMNLNPSFVMTNCGPFMWDTNMFPHGLPWLIATLKTNSIGTVLDIYGSAIYNTPPGASGLTIGDSGGPVVPYTNGVGSGYIYTNGSYKSVEFVGADMLPYFVSEMMWWGAEGVVLNDYQNPVDGVLATERLVADSTLKFNYSHGFNQALTNSYFNQNFSVISWGSTNGWGQTNPESYLSTWDAGDWAAYFTNQIWFIPYETSPRPGGPADLPNPFGDMTRQFHNAVNWENFDAPQDGRGLLAWSQDYPSGGYIYQGARFLSVLSGPPLAADFASAVFCVDTYTNAAMMQDSYYLTNSQYTTLPLALDPLQLMPTLAHDYGTNAGTVWGRQMANGDVCVFVSSEPSGSNNWIPTITWDMFNLKTNDYYAVSVVSTWGPVASWLPVTNKIGITNVLLDTGSQCILRLTQIPDASQLYGAGAFTGNGSGLANIPLTGLQTMPLTNNQSAVVLSGSFTGNGAGLTNLNVSIPTTGNYLFSYDTTTQTAAAANTYQDVNFGFNAQLNGWTHTAATAVFSAGQTGLYLLQYNGEAGLTASTTASISLRWVVNGAEVPGSQAAVTLNDSSLSQTCSKSCLVSLNAGDMLKLQFTASTTQGELTPPSGGTGAIKPSVSMTAVRIQ